MRAPAPAGTQRLSNRLRSPKWAAAELVRDVWQCADTRVGELQGVAEPALLIWDTSVLEKPESLASPDRGWVRSSTARRLTRINPGCYQLPSRPAAQPPALCARLAVARPLVGRGE